MKELNNINLYYKNIIETIIEEYDKDFNDAIPGHCMKITGLGSDEMEYLWDSIADKYSHIDTYIVAEELNQENKYITATKLIELRNKQEKPLLVLIPSNSRTAAEDSYGNATFKEIKLEGIENKLKTKLVADIPSEFQRIIKDDILGYIGNDKASTTNIINFLLTLNDFGLNRGNIGNLLYQFHLLPDAELLKEEEKIRHRLNFNITSMELLSSFNKPLYDRINELPLKKDTLQRKLVQFIKDNNGLKSGNEIGEIIYKNYPELNFSEWQIPDLNFKHIKLKAEEIKSAELKVVDGKNVIKVEENKICKVKVKFTTNPKPKDISEFKFFKIMLMTVDGGAGVEMNILRKSKNTNADRSYREAIVELNPNIIEEGSYFFKVLAEDDKGNVLNYEDDFKDNRIQSAWEEQKSINPALLRSTFNFKLTCDTDDFDFIIEDADDKDETDRKHKLNNVLQAYHKFKIDLLKYGGADIDPMASESSNIWLNDEKAKHTSTFHVNYGGRHNYQINLSTKLRKIENEIINNSHSFGHVRVYLQNNSTALNFESIQFVPSEVTTMVPNPILKLRKDIFKLIQESNEKKNGVFETCDFYNFKSKVKTYLDKYATWTSDLKKQISSNDLSDEEKAKIQQFLTELQILDVARVRTKLPDGKPVEAILLCPLHPLRLSWHLQISEVFGVWEQKTREYDGYKKTWTNNLENLFSGSLSPENNPLVLVEPATFKDFHYTGELAYGWGLYLNAVTEETSQGMTSISRQLKHYFRTLFNITRDNYVENDISRNLVVRHIKNYLIQHPYTDKLILNLINSGDTHVFADAFVELEKDKSFKDIKYEIRIFRGDDRIIEHGEALRTLLNPDSNISEEAESFSQPSNNRLFPKLRFSINNMTDYMKYPARFTAHMSFMVSPFPIQIELIKPRTRNRNFYLNGVISDSTVTVEEQGDSMKWNRFVQGNELNIKYSGSGKTGITIFDNIQSFVSGALASRYTESIPATQLILNEKDKVLIAHLHDYSDWVVTFDKNLGPEIFDQPTKDGNIPFLLDYVPGEEVTGISSYLTTRPTSEVLGLLGPHFEAFDLDVYNPEDEKKIKILLEDLRAVSSSLVLQLNSSKNKAFEVIGSAFTKRVLEKKGFLKDAFLIPIDLHQNLFENLVTEIKSRADNLLISIQPEKREILITVLEIKCRKSIGASEKEELKVKMKEQIQNTIEAIRMHFDPSYQMSYDRLDREIKNKELKSLLAFYMERAYRYEYLSENAFATYHEFLQDLDKGFIIKFNQIGLIFDFSASKRHLKEIADSDLIYFTFGHKLIEEILDPDSDLNTRRLEDNDFNTELKEVLGAGSVLKPFIHKIKGRMPVDPDDAEADEKNAIPKDEVGGQSELNSTSNPVENVEPNDEPESNIIFSPPVVERDGNHISPEFDILVGKSSPSEQYGLLGETMQNKKIAIDLSETNTISLFGVQGGGKSYTIGTISEMVLKEFSQINQLPAPLAGVIFHYSESMDYEPEFTSMISPNSNEGELKKLKDRYGANPDNIEDVILLTPRDKIEERQAEFPSIEVLPIAFNSQELNVQDWLFLLGAVGNDSAYIKQLKAIMKEQRQNLNLIGITEAVENTILLSNAQKALARQKLSFAREYIDDSFTLKDTLKPGRLIIVDLRDEFIVKEEALGLFVIMLNIFSGVKSINGNHFNKFIVFDEAHKYMDNKDLTGNIVTAIREMRHKGVSIMIASQDPPSLPNEIIELSSIVLLHKFNSPQWLKHIQKSITQLSGLTPADMSSLAPGDGFLWATKATDKSISSKPVKITTRPRVTQHGGSTVQATGKA
jgi:hypothetical protein